MSLSLPLYPHPHEHLKSQNLLTLKFMEFVLDCIHRAQAIMGLMLGILTKLLVLGSIPSTSKRKEGGGRKKKKVRIAH